MKPFILKYRMVSALSPHTVKKRLQAGIDNQGTVDYFVYGKKKYKGTVEADRFHIKPLFHFNPFLFPNPSIKGTIRQENQKTIILLSIGIPKSFLKTYGIIFGIGSSGLVMLLHTLIVFQHTLSVPAPFSYVLPWLIPLAMILFMLFQFQAQFEEDVEDNLDILKARMGVRSCRPVKKI